jgi:hypothetical protein
MPGPERTTADKLLVVLAIFGGPLECGELAERLQISKQRARTVLEQLIAQQKVVATPGQARQVGRPPMLFSLPGLEPAPRDPGSSDPYFDPQTCVVMPSGREARVIAMRPKGFCEIEYLHCRSDHEPRTTVKAKILRAFQPGRDKPRPMRMILEAIPTDYSSE